MAPACALLMVLQVATGCIDYNVGGRPAQPSDPGGDTSPEESLVPVCPVVQPTWSQGEVTRACYDVPVGFRAPEVLWHWQVNPIHPGYEHVMMTPIAIPLTDRNGDGEVTRADGSDIVFTAFETDNFDTAIVAVSGTDGDTLWSVRMPDDSRWAFASGAAAARLTSDGDVRIVVKQSTPSRVAALDRFGAVVWVSDGESQLPGEVIPRMADLDGDGNAEILAGSIILDDQGRTIGRLDQETPDGEPLSSEVDVFDVDADGLAEVFRTHVFYRYDPTEFDILQTYWVSDNRTGFGVAVADFDGEGDFEVLAEAYESLELPLGLHLRNADGTLVWRQPETSLGGGVTTIADVDGDGQPEIVRAGPDFLSAVEGNGSLLWQVPVQDTSSGQAAAAAYDFTAEGALDLVYGDEETFYIVDGPSGEVLHSDPSHGNRTLLEHPIIVDLDGDGSVEIVVANNIVEWGESKGIRVYTNPDGTWRADATEWPWSGARPHELDDDLRPRPASAVSAENPDLLRGVRRTGGIADLAVARASWCVTECSYGKAVLYVNVENRGYVAVPEGAVLTVVGETSGTVMGQRELTEGLESHTRFGAFTFSLELDQVFSEGGVRVEVTPAGELEDCLDSNQVLHVEVPDCGS